MCIDSVDECSEGRLCFRVKEACTVLTLSAGSALLLKEILYNALHESRAAPLTDPIAALHDIGVYKTELEDVELLLSLRVDLGVM